MFATVSKPQFQGKGCLAAVCPVCRDRPAMSTDRSRSPLRKLQPPCRSGPKDITGKFAKALALEASPETLDQVTKCIRALVEQSPNGVLRVGSICSGTGGGDYGLAAILNVIGMLSPTSGISAASAACVFCCEYCEQKAQFLRDNLNPPIIFQNAIFMGERAAMNVNSKTLQEIPGVELLTAGFSCRDLSALNNNRAAKFEQIEMALRSCFELTESELNKMAVAKSASTTALTLTGVLRYVGRHKPKRVILENVLGFSKIIKDVRALLASKGYVSEFVETCPSTLGFPVTRHRIYLVAAFDPLGVGVACMKNTFRGVFHLHQEKMRHSFRMQIADFMFDGDSAAFDKWVCSTVEHHGEKSQMDALKDAKWEGKHAAAFKEMASSAPTLCSWRTWWRHSTPANTSARCFIACACVSKSACATL